MAEVKQIDIVRAAKIGAVAAVIVAVICEALMLCFVWPRVSRSVADFGGVPEMCPIPTTVPSGTLPATSSGVACSTTQPTGLSGSPSAISPVHKPNCLESSVAGVFNAVIHRPLANCHGKGELMVRMSLMTMLCPVVGFIGWIISVLLYHLMARRVG